MLAAWLHPDDAAVKRMVSLATGALGVLACVAVVCLWLLVSSPIDDIAGVEPYVVYTLSELNAGLPLYKDPQQAPFSVTQYAPLFYVLVHGLGALVDATTARELTFLARSVSAGFLCAQLGLVFWVACARFHLSRRAAAATVLAVMLATAPWQVCARPDSMQSFFGLLTLVALLEYATSERRVGWLLLATVVASASVFVKQNGIINAMAVVAVTLVTREWRRAMVGCLTAGACIGLGVGACIVVWGPAFLANVVTGVRNGIQLDPALLDTFTTLSGLYLPLLLGGVFLGLRAVQAESSSKDVRALAVFALVSLGVASVLALKRGSAVNYFNDYFVTSILVIAVCTSARWKGLPSSVVPMALVGAFVWLTTLFVRNLAVPVGYAQAARGGPHDYTLLVPLAERLRAEVRAENAYAVTRHAGLAAALSPMAILPMPAITDQLYADGMLDKGVLTDWLRNHGVSRVIVPDVGSSDWYGPVELEQKRCRTERSGAFVVHAACVDSVGERGVSEFPVGTKATTSTQPVVRTADAEPNVSAPTSEPANTVVVSSSGTTCPHFDEGELFEKSRPKRAPNLSYRDALEDSRESAKLAGQAFVKRQVLVPNQASFEVYTEHTEAGDTVFVDVVAEGYRVWTLKGFESTEVVGVTKPNGDSGPVIGELSMSTCPGGSCGGGCDPGRYGAPLLIQWYEKTLGLVPFGNPGTGELGDVDGDGALELAVNVLAVPLSSCDAWWCCGAVKRFAVTTYLGWDKGCWRADLPRFLGVHARELQQVSTRLTTLRQANRNDARARCELATAATSQLWLTELANPSLSPSQREASAKRWEADLANFEPVDCFPESPDPPQLKDYAYSRGDVLEAVRSTKVFR